MANLIIKPQNTSGDKVIIQDQAGGAVLTTADSGATITNATIPTITGNVTASGNLTVAGDIVPSVPLSHRNMIINGAMNVAQRATTSSSNRNSGYQCVDRFRCQETNLGNIAIVQSQYTMSSADLNTTGLSKAFKMDVNTAESAIGASEKWSIDYRFEGRDLQHLQYGTANAQSVTLSFWAKSNVAGVYGISMLQTDGAKRIGSTYTLASNVWKKVSITFIGNTADLIVNDKTQGLEITWGLLVGGDYTGGTNTSWGATANNKYFNGHTAVWGTSTSDDFYLTGVQLELGSTATPFEHRTYQEDHIKCCRYYQILQGLGGMCAPALQNSSTNYAFTLPLVTPLRSSPTLTRTGNLTMCRHNGYETLTAASNVYWRSDPIQPSVDFAGAGLSQGSDMYGGMMYCGTTKFELYAEL